MGQCEAISTSTVKDSFTVAKGWRKRGAGRIKLMNTTKTQVRSTDEALSVKQPCCVEDTLKMALETLEDLSNTNSYWWQEVDQDTVDKIEPTITAIKEALMSFCDGAQPAVTESHKQRSVSEHLKERSSDEPVAYFNPQVKGGFYWARPTKITAPVTVNVEPMPLYTTPPQRTWVNATMWRGLTDDERKTIAEANNMLVDDDLFDEIEAKLKAKNERKEKNNGT